MIDNNEPRMIYNSYWFRVKKKHILFIYSDEWKNKAITIYYFKTSRIKICRKITLFFTNPTHKQKQFLCKKKYGVNFKGFGNFFFL